MTDADRRFALDVTSALASDPDRGARILNHMRITGAVIDVEAAVSHRAYAERVWHGLERAPLSDAGGSRAPIVEEADEAARD